MKRSDWVRCSLCSEMVVLVELGEHVFQEHVGSAGAVWKCGTCPFQAVSRGEMTVHCFLSRHPALGIAFSEALFVSLLDTIQKDSLPPASPAPKTTIEEADQLTKTSPDQPAEKLSKPVPSQENQPPKKRSTKVDPPPKRKSQNMLTEDSDMPSKKPKNASAGKEYLKTKNTSPYSLNESSAVDRLHQEAMVAKPPLSIPDPSEQSPIIDDVVEENPVTEESRNGPTQSDQPTSTQTKSDSIQKEEMSSEGEESDASADLSRESVNEEGTLETAEADEESQDESTGFPSEDEETSTLETTDVGSQLDTEESAEPQSRFDRLSWDPTPALPDDLRFRCLKCGLISGRGRVKASPSIHTLLQHVAGKPHGVFGTPFGTYKCLLCPKRYNEYKKALEHLEKEHDREGGLQFLLPRERVVEEMKAAFPSTILTYPSLLTAIQAHFKRLDPSGEESPSEERILTEELPSAEEELDAADLSAECGNEGTLKTEDDEDSGAQDNRPQSPGFPITEDSESEEETSQLDTSDVDSSQPVHMDVKEPQSHFSLLSWDPSPSLPANLRFSCIKCGLINSKKGFVKHPKSPLLTLLQHVTSKSHGVFGPPPYKCSLCPKRNADYQKALDHLEVDHDREGVLQFLLSRERVVEEIKTAFPSTILTYPRLITAIQAHFDRLRRS